MSKPTIIPYFTAKVDPKMEMTLPLWFSNPKMLRQYLEQYSGREIQVSIRLRKKPRSLNQNSYYWGVIVSLIAEFTGMTIDETHEALKNKLLKQKKAVKRGDKLIWEVDTVRSTASLGTAEFEEYVADVRNFASADLGLVIPLPNEIDLERI